MSGTAIALFMVGVLLAALTPRWLARLVGVVLLFAALIVGGELVAGVAKRRAHPKCLVMAECRHDPAQHAEAARRGARTPARERRVPTQRDAGDTCLAPKGAR